MWGWAVSGKAEPYRKVRRQAARVDRMIPGYQISFQVREGDLLGVINSVDRMVHT